MVEVHEKRLETGAITLVEIFPSAEEAQEWVRDMSKVWGEWRAYKIVEVV